MAIYSLNLGFISRSAGRSAVGFSAYISGGQQQDKRTGVSYDYGCKSDVILSRILAPEDAPEWARISSTLWNRVEQFEDEWGASRFQNEEAREQFLSSAQTAQTIMGAIPLEFTQLEAEACVEEFLKERFVSRGLVVEYALHWDKGNPHFHGMVTRRSFVEGEFFQRKEREIVSKSELLVTRKLWETVVNKHLELGGHEVRIDCRSHEDRGSLFLPTAHEGWHAQRLAEQGQYSRIVADNEATRQRNIEILCTHPEALIQEVALKRTTFTRKHIEEEIIRRVGGDEKLFCLLKAKVEGVDVPSELILKQSNDDVVFEGGQLRNLAAKLTGQLLENKDIVHDVGENINRDRIFTSAAYKKQEEHIVDFAESLHQRQTKEVPEEAIVKAIKKGEVELGNSFSEEQRTAIHHLCSGPDIRVLNGKAGTGKTTLLKAVAAAYQEAGYEVMGTSFQGKAVEIMEQEVGVPCKTLDSFKCAWENHQRQKELVEGKILWGRPYLYAFNRMKELEKDRLTSKNVILVDEANMVGGHLWEPFLEEAASKGAKVLIIQDPAQIKSREPGDYGRLFAERYGFCETNEVVRQRIPWQGECSKLLNDYQVLEGLKPYYDKGHFKWFEDTSQVHGALAQDYVSDFIRNSHQTRMALAYRNTEVYALNQSIRGALKEKGYLTESFKIHAKEYAIGDRIRFMQNDNHGQYIHNVNESSFPASLLSGGLRGQKKGVKNGSFGTIESFDERTSLLTVALEDKRRIQFDVNEYTHITHGYAMGIHKSEGSTFDRSFIAFDQLMDSSTLLVSMTRHREDVQAYVNCEQFIDFKDVIDKINQGSFKETLQDYVVSEDQKPYFTRVQQYRDLLIESGTLREEMEANLEAKTPLYKHPSYQAYQACFEEKKRVATEILAEWQNHAPYARLAGLRKDVLEVEVGLRPRLLSDLEYRASIQVQGYMDLVKETRVIWNTISQTHPGVLAKSHTLYEDYASKKADRDSLAAVFQENPKLYTPFLKVTKDEASGEFKDYWGEPVDKENRVYISALKSHAEAHKRSQFQNLYYEILPQDQKASYDVVKDYITTRNEAAAIYGHLQKKAEDAVQIASPESFISLDTFHALQVKRDALALKIINSPEKYQEFFGILKIKEDKLLDHAVAGELREKVKAYTSEQDVGKRASQAQELQRILSTSKDYKIFKESGLDIHRLTFDIAFYDKVKSREITSNIHPDQIYKPIQTYLNSSKETARLWKMAQLKGKQENIDALKKDWRLALTARNENARLLVSDQASFAVALGLRQEIRQNILRQAGLIERGTPSDLKRSPSVPQIAKTTPINSLHASQSFLSVEQVLQATRGNIESLVTDLLGVPNKHMGTKASLRFGTRGSMLVNIAGPKEGQWKDFESGEKGNIIHLVQREKNLDFKEAVVYLADALNVRGQGSSLLSKELSHSQKQLTIQVSKEQLKEIASKLNAVLELHLKSKPIGETLAETYLRKERNILSSLPPDLRYIPKGTVFMYQGERKTIQNHCLAVFGRNQEGRLSSVQITKLTDQGRRALAQTGEKFNKIHYGIAKGSFTLLQDDKASNRVFMAEGIETALSIKEAGVKGKIVASMGIHNMVNYQGPEKEIIICADNDEHKPNSQTHKTIKKTENHFQAQDKSASIVKPSQAGDDFNDVLKKQGAQAVQEYMKDYLNPDRQNLLRSHPLKETNQIQKTTLDPKLSLRNETLNRVFSSSISPLSSSMKKPEPNSIETVSDYVGSLLRKIKVFEGYSLGDEAKQELKTYMQALQKNEITLAALKTHNPELAQEAKHFIQSQMNNKNKEMER